MRLQSGKIIHMADEISNVNGGSSTNDSIPVSAQQANVTSRSEGAIGTESIAVMTVKTGNAGRNTRLRGTLPPFQPPLTVGWPPYGLPPGYTPPVGGFIPPIRFGNTSGGSNSQNPQQHSEYSRDYNVGSTSNAANSIAVYRQQVEKIHHELVNLLTEQITTILNPMMADHESKFERLARQVKRIARIVDYEEGERHNARGNNEGFENIFQNENDVVNGKIPHVVPRNQNVDDFLARLRNNHGSERYQVTRIVEMIKDRDISLYPRCNDVFDAEAAAIFEKERMKKELAHREEQARQRQPIWRYEGQSSKTPHQSSAAPLSRSQAIGVQWIRNCQEFQKRDHLYRRNPQWGIGGLLEISTLIIVVALEDIIEAEEAGEMSIRIRSLRWNQSSGVDKSKEEDVDEEYFEEGDDDMIGTISIIPTEYLGEYEGDPEKDYDMEDEEAFSFIRIEDEPGMYNPKLKPLNVDRTLNSYNCECCYLSSEGLSVKLRYPELGFALTGWDCLS
ncbi:hypothetical protein Ahy_B04g071662 [Arachis hypogaea]|uniref:Uncharacterized protein n=1 Tax=Arachis hypogaea TaxID=3818 RepID=A0A444ZLC0_ARAHY|nr:hypothetical protein Ahy_B04g071662 [Arachis hypogaea]